jgi:hypothetical protein
VRDVCAHDVGMIVNPETLRRVIDRQFNYGTSRTMLAEVRFSGNASAAPCTNRCSLSRAER